MNTRVKLSELVDAFEWVSATGPYENEAYVSLASGRIWMITDFDDEGEEPPEDIGDESLYLAVPGKNELDLGRRLALRFAEAELPQDHEQIRDFFRKAGAYGRFKNLLAERERLDDWYAYEAKGIEEALRSWAADNDIELIAGPDKV